MKVKMTVSTAGKRISVDVDEKQADKTVSYTHLTLPTICSV